MTTTGRVMLIVLAVILVGAGGVLGIKYFGKTNIGNSSGSLMQGVRDDVLAIIPEKIGGETVSTNKPVVISATGSTVTFDDVYTVARQGSVQYLSDQRYSYAERLDQLAKHFQNNSDELWTSDSLSANRDYLVEKKYTDDQFGDERYLTRRTILTKFEDFTIINGASLAEHVIATSDVDVIPDENNLVFHPTGPSPRFIFAYDKKGTLAIENNEVGGEGVRLYSEGKPEVILFELQPGNHIKEVAIQVASNETELYTTNQYGYYQKHMGGGNIPVLRGAKEHEIILQHSDGISSVLKNAYVVYHDYKGTNSANVSWEKLQKEFGRDRAFIEMFYNIYSDQALVKFENSAQRSHRLIDKPVAKTSKGQTSFNLTIPSALTDEEDYFSLIFQDSHDFRYTLPFRALPDSAQTVWVDEQTTPSRQHREGDTTKTYPRLVGQLTFPRGIVAEELQKKLDDIYGKNVVVAQSDWYVWNSEDEKNARTTFSLEYRLPPNQSRTDKISVKDAYGDTYTREQSLTTKAIPKYHLKASIQGSDINLLPKDGYRGSHIQLIETNMPSVQLRFTPCTVGTDPAKVGQDVTLEERLLNCNEQGAIVTTYDLSKESKRWKETEHTIALPSGLANVDAFKVSIANDIFQGRERGRYHQSYFFKTNIGLYSKVDDKSLYVRGWDLASGKPVTDGSITITDSAGKSSTHAMSDIGAIVELTPALLASEWLVIDYGTNSTGATKSTLIVSPSKANSVYSNDGMYGPIHSRVDPMQLYQTQPRYWDSNSALEKVYGYTDRGLYRPGDTVNFAGFTRDMSKLGWDKTKTEEFAVTATIQSVITDMPLQNVENLKLDEFGGFAGSFQLPQETPLGTYIVDYVVAQGERYANYQHTIQVKEFTKPTYEIRGDLLADETISVEVDPWYYFGAPVDRYDVSVAATLIPQERCRDCRWYADSEKGEYTNFQFGGGQSARVDRSLTDLQDPVEIPLFTRSEIPDPTATYDLVADLVVIDKRTGERMSKQFTDAILSLVQITLSGQPIEWLYADDKQPEISLSIADEKGLVDHTVASWYFEPYGYATQKGVDGEMYTIHGHEMTFVSSGLVRNEIDYPEMDSQGTYLLRVQSFDNKNNLLATNEKRIENYTMEVYGRYFGELQNNTIRNVQGPTKTVDVGDEIALDVNPYILGTTAIITVERGNRILDVFQRELDGKVISIPAKEVYYPNVHIGIHSVVGEQKSVIAERKEPRLLQGYAEVSVNRIDTVLDIKLSTDQDTYEPGNKAQLKISTQDYAGKPIDARVSVAVIDKSLVDLYNIVKEPIPYFFNKMGTNVGTYTNLRFLYQMLRVYITPGDKGGGGSDVAGRFGQNRDDFKDVAYWKADVYTKNGEAMVEVDLPDNLTTWVIDTIGISAGTHLGTATKTIVVDKKVKVTPYFPQYLTIGDEITFPLSAMGREGDVHNDLVASGTMQFAGRSRSISFVPSRHQNDQRYGVLHLPAGMQTGDALSVSISIIDKKTEQIYDQLTQEIPVRTKGFVQRTTTLGLDQQGTMTTSLSGEIIGGQARIYISTFPVESRRRVVEYLITYPYGCAEQKMSSLLPLLLLPDLEKVGAVNEKVYANGMVKIEQGTTTQRVSRDQVIKDTLQGLMAFQADNGGFDYWVGTPKSADYGLSLSIYGGLLQAWKYGYIEPDSALDGMLKKVETYLATTPPDREQEQIDTTYLMMARQQASAGRAVGADQQAVVEQLWEKMSAASSISSKDHFNAILLFGTLALQGEVDRTEDLLDKISWNQLSYPYTQNNIYWNDISLHAIALQGLAALEGEGDNARVQADQVLLSLLKLQDADGLRGRSTQSNMQVFMGLSAFMQARGLQNSDDKITCQITLNGTGYEMAIEKDAVDAQLTLPFDAKTVDVTSEWTCNSTVIYDQTVERLPADISTIQASSNDIDILESDREVENTTPIGMLDTLHTTFAIDNDAEHLAVEMYLPATHRFVATTSSEFVGGENVPFEIEGDYVCQPNHFEVRYDRLFLYYKSMEAGTRCEVRIEAIKSLTGKAGVMPTHLYEMYRARVFGNTEPLQTISK